jgi:hypothetical protein
MKTTLLASLLLSGLASCTEPTTERLATPKAPTLAASPVPAIAIPVRHPLSVGRVDTVDHFFYTNQRHKQVGELNHLDMFKLDSDKVLSVCGKEVGRLRYKLGDTVEAFLAQNLKETAGLNLNEVRIIDWSSDLRGEDDRFFFIKQGRLKKVREQNAPDLAQLRDTW